MRTAFQRWCECRESNPDQWLRRPLHYPLCYIRRRQGDQLSRAWRLFKRISTEEAHLPFAGTRADDRPPRTPRTSGSTGPLGQTGCQVPQSGSRCRPGRCSRRQTSRALTTVGRLVRSVTIGSIRAAPAGREEHDRAVMTRQTALARRARLAFQATFASPAAHAVRIPPGSSAA